MSEISKINNYIFSNINITAQENNIIKLFEFFYLNNENSNIFLKLISTKSNISIRLIDFFITKYAKINKTNYILKENNNEQTFNIYTSYKQQLKGYQKKYFDPFSRGERIPFYINDIFIITTIGQLNFFKWFISKKIYNYVLLNQNIIDSSMNQKNVLKVTKKKAINHTPISKPSKIQYLSNYRQTNNIINTKQNEQPIVVSFCF